MADLTREFASTAELPLNPFARHDEVMAMLSDPDMVGAGVELEVSRVTNFVLEKSNGDAIIGVSSMLPLLGRGTLLKTAGIVEGLENLREEK